MRTLLIVPLLVALPACRSLGSPEADAARVADVANTIGTVAARPLTTENVIPIVTDIAAREAARRIEALPEGESLDLWTQLLIGLGVAGTAFTTAKSALRVREKTPTP